MKSIKTYRELIQFPTFEERYEYLKLNGSVSEFTFGSMRYINQKFYTSKEWRHFRRDVILRDNGCDLAISDRHISGLIVIHHLNQIQVTDLIDMEECLLDFDNVVCVSLETHNAIHYGDVGLLMPSTPVERKPGDTKLW